MTTGNRNRTTLELQDYSRVAGPTGTATKTYRNCRNYRTYKHYVIRLTGTTRYGTYYRNYYRNYYRTYRNMHARKFSRCG